MRHAPEPLTADQIRRLFDPETRIPPRDRALLALLACTGLRLREAVRLTIAHVAPYGQIAPVLQFPASLAKTHRPRTLPLPPYCRDMLDAYLAWLRAQHPDLGPDSPLWYAYPRRTPLSPRGLEHVVAVAGRALWQRTVSPHDLRHSYATELRHHTDLSTLQALLGHRRLSSTQRYLHCTLPDLTAATHALWLSPQPQQQPTAPSRAHDRTAAPLFATHWTP